MVQFEKGQSIIVTREQANRCKHKELVDVMDRAMPKVDRLKGVVKNVEDDTVWVAFPKVDQQGQYSFSADKLRASLQD